MRTSTWDGVFESSSSVTEMRGAAGRHSLCCSRAVEFSVLPYLLTPRTYFTYLLTPRTYLLTRSSKELLGAA